MPRWTRSLTLLPGLRVLPDTTTYEVADCLHDVNVYWSDGEVQRACLVSHWTPTQWRCIHPRRLRDLIIEAITQTQPTQTVLTVEFRRRFQNRNPMESWSLPKVPKRKYPTPSQYRAPWAAPLKEWQR